jgi:putative superfamily III holin-X
VSTYRAAGITRLVRDEAQLTLGEFRVKATRTGLAVGLGGIAALSALVGVMALATTAVIALDYVLPAWLSAFLVGAALRVEFNRARPVVTPETVTGIRKDVAATKGHRT